MIQSSVLATTFLDKRADLRRYLAARVGDDEADDLIQETYLRVLQVHADTEIRSPAAYLYRLANNIMLDRRRQTRARAARDGGWHAATVTTTASGEDMDDGVTAEQTMIARDRLDRLRSALGKLPEPVQETFRLHKIEGLSHSEVATRLGVSRSLVEKRMMTALRHLLAVPQ